MHWPTVAADVIGVLVQIPFMAQALYTGPLTKQLGGADVSWVVGLVVTSLRYCPIGRRAFDYPSAMVYPDPETREVKS